MTTDRELLEMAAKAAGIAGFWVDAGINIGSNAAPLIWNPLTDDGDALRLAVRLHLEIDHNHPLDSDLWVMACQNGLMVGQTEELEDEGQRLAATRRAIVRAAAEIGASK
jgi:hypothetical protein